MYNSEIWTLNVNDEKAIDSFQMRILRRYVLNNQWKQKIKTKSVYEITNQIPWSKTIAHRRLIWFGHLARLPDKTPAKRALIYALKQTKQPSGRPRNTWINLIKKTNEIRT